MKFVTFCAKEDRIGFVVENKVVDLRLAYASYLKEVENDSAPLKQAYSAIPSTMIDFLDGEERSLEIAKKVYEFVYDKIEKGKQLESPSGEKIIHDLKEIKLRAPIPIPRLMVDFSTFEEHVKMSFEKMGQKVPEEWYVMPVGYKMNPYSVIGPEDPIIYPSYTQLLDYELEFAVVIGKKGKNIPKEKAYDFVFGYTIVNDVSARDVEYIELKAMPLGPLKSKDFDSATPMGPWIVTKDEIADPHNLKMVARVNGEVWSEASTRNMYWKIPDLIEHLSREQTLYPGMIFLSGTPGHGCGLHIGRFLNPGDVVELEIEKIGVLRNRVVKET